MADTLDHDSMRFHVALLPNEEQRQAMIELSVSLNTEGDNIIELGDHAVPHVTLYNPEIPKHRHNDGCKIIEQLANDLCGIELGDAEYTAAPWGDHGLFLSYDNDEEVRRLRENVINAINPIREGRVRARWRGNKEHAEDIKKYGYPVFFYHFPHVTLAKFNDQSKRDQALEELRQQVPLSFTVGSVAVLETGPHGTGKRIIKEYLI